MKVARQSLHNFVTIAANALNGLVLTAVFARALGPETMGHYSLVTTCLTLAGLVVNGGWVTTVVKHVAAALGAGEPERAHAAIAAAWRRMGRLGAGVALLWVLLAPPLAAALGQGAQSTLFVLAGLAIVPTAWMALGVGASQGLQDYRLVARLSLLYTGLVAGLSLGALAAGLGAAGLLAANAVAAGLVSWRYGASFKRRFGKPLREAVVQPELRAELGSYARPLTAVVLLDAIVWQRAGVFAVGAFRSPSEVAFYALGFAFAMMAMRMVPGVLVGLLIPKMSAALGAGRRAEAVTFYRSANRAMSYLAFPTAVGGAALAPALALALYGPAFGEVAPILALFFAVSAWVMAFGFPASSLLYAANGQRYVLRSGLYVASFNILLLALLTPRWGATGAAAATAAAQALSIPIGVRQVRVVLPEARPDFGAVPGALGSAGVMGAAIALLVAWLPPAAAIGASLALGPVVYAAALWSFGLTRADREAARPLVAKLAARLRGRRPAAETA